MLKQFCLLLKICSWETGNGTGKCAFLDHRFRLHPAQEIYGLIGLLIHNDWYVRGRTRVVPSSSAAVSFNLAVVQAYTLIERLTTGILIPSAHSGMICLELFWPACSLIWNQRAAVAARLLLQGKFIYVCPWAFLKSLHKHFCRWETWAWETETPWLCHPVPGLGSAYRAHCLQNPFPKSNLNGNESQRSGQQSHL